MSIIRTWLIRTRQSTEWYSRPFVLKLHMHALIWPHPQYNFTAWQLHYAHFLCIKMAEGSRKRKRIVLTIEEKIKICESVRSGRSPTSVAQEFNVGKSTVHDIVKNEGKLKQSKTEIENGDCIKKWNVVRRADFPELDKAVYLWFVQQ